MPVQDKRQKTRARTRGKKETSKKESVMKKVVIIGGGFAGVTCAITLSKDSHFEVEVIDAKDFFEISFAQLAALTEPIEIGEHSRFNYRSFLKAKFTQNSVKSISSAEIAFTDNSSIGYDILVIASGSNYKSFPIGKPTEQRSLKDRNSFFKSENAKLLNAKSAVIIGGGPVGVELAGEISTKYPDKKITLIHGNSRLLDFLTDKASRKASSLLESLGVTIILNERIAFLKDNIYKSTINETLYEADIFYNCIGTKPNTDFMKAHFSSSIDERGQLIVDEHFKVINIDNAYAIGDCNNIPEAKLGYLASLHGDLLAKNLTRGVLKKSPKAYRTKKTMALVPIGREKGVVQLPFGVFTNKFLVKIKTKDFFISKYAKLFGANHPI
jgi:apoptosis-inducing factor 2